MKFLDRVLGCRGKAGAESSKLFPTTLKSRGRRGPERKELRRITYPAGTSNRVLGQLLELQAGSERDGIFDKLSF